MASMTIIKKRLAYTYKEDKDPSTGKEKVVSGNVDKLNFNAKNEDVVKLKELVSKLYENPANLSFAVVELNVCV